MQRRVRMRGEASDLLVLIWNLYRAGEVEDAKLRLLYTWSWGMDALSEEQWARVALGLMRRLGFCTDDHEAWEALPDPFIAYRVGGPGLTWTAESEIAEYLATRYGLSPISERSVRKDEVLAFITHYGEAEVILDPLDARG